MQTGKVVALSGGVGGAKLVAGLAEILPPEDLTVIVNTGDDFTHLGLRICPDLDTVVYTLAGVADPVQGWGRAQESWRALGTLRELGGPDWFQLGDLDLGLHLRRTQLLQEGLPLSEASALICRHLGVLCRVLPATDSTVSTMVLTDEGELHFQDYFVARRCEPTVSGFRFSGVDKAQPAPGVIDAIQEADLIVIGPSNPWVSIDPILAVPGIRSALSDRKLAAVSPIVGGKALKGPAAKMFSELGITPSAASVADHYRDLLQGFIMDEVDLDQAGEVEQMGMRVLVTDTIMSDHRRRVRLAEQVLAFARL